MWGNPVSDVECNTSVKCGKLYAEENNVRVFHRKASKTSHFMAVSMENHVEIVEKGCG